jgi:hypothetical protein
VHDVVGDRRQLEIVVSGVAAQCVESCVEAEAVALGKNALRLFDRDPARQPALRLLPFEGAPRRRTTQRRRRRPIEGYRQRTKLFRLDFRSEAL